jgi:hypothetical protein
VGDSFSGMSDSGGGMGNANSGGFGGCNCSESLGADSWETEILGSWSNAARDSYEALTLSKSQAQKSPDMQGCVSGVRSTLSYASLHPDREGLNRRAMLRQVGVRQKRAS